MLVRWQVKKKELNHEITIVILLNIFKIYLIKIVCITKNSSFLMTRHRSF